MEIIVFCTAHGAWTQVGLDAGGARPWENYGFPKTVKTHWEINVRACAPCLGCQLRATLRSNTMILSSGKHWESMVPTHGSVLDPSMARFAMCGTSAVATDARKPEFAAGGATGRISRHVK